MFWPGRIAEPIRATVHNRQGDRSPAAHQGDHVGSGAAGITQDNASSRYKFAAKRLDERKRATCIRHIHSRKDHRSTGADLEPALCGSECIVGKQETENR